MCTIRRADEVVIVTHLSASLGVLLAVVSAGVFIYFTHHVSVSIQTNEIAVLVGTKLIEGSEESNCRIYFLLAEYRVTLPV
ncbi:DUF2254 domain-containing protein [Desulfobulbus sp. N2]|nr:DUF2254 domain-containing protein [Desulfobulbus sp. US4]MCW5204829.1 DUF2254 domain-containing protein [Desulfobulbus sp. N2]